MLSDKTNMSWESFAKAGACGDAPLHQMAISMGKNDENPLALGVPYLQKNLQYGIDMYINIYIYR